MKINYKYQYSILLKEMRAQRAVSIYIILTPLLWMLGLLFPLGALLVLWLLFKGLSSRVIVDKVVLAWWLVAVMQALSVIINCINADKAFSYLLYRLLSAPVSGWFFLGAALAVGKIYNFTSNRIVRANSIMGLYLLIFGAVSFIVLKLQKVNLFEVLSPLGYLLPNWLPSVHSLFTMRFYSVELVFNYPFPRLVLFYPWSVCLGFAGIGLFFIALNENKPLWKMFGIIGGIFALISSLSRAAIISFFLSCIIYLWLKIHNAYRWLFISIFCLVSVPFMFLNFSVIDYTENTYNFITELRAGSSSARQLGYEASWEGFLKSPFIGHGWIGEYIDYNIPIPIGSHSTFYGLLYTGGLLTFIPFCIAISLTIVSLLLRAIRGSAVHISAFVVTLSLAIMSYTEGIFSFVIPTLLIFFWFGGALRDPNPIHKEPYK